MITRTFNLKYFHPNGLLSNQKAPGFLEIDKIHQYTYLNWLNEQKYIEDFLDDKIIVYYKDYHDNDKYISYDYNYFWSLSRAITLWNVETIDLILMQLDFNNQTEKIEKVLSKIEDCYYDWTSKSIEKRNQALKFVQKVSKEFNIYKENGPIIKVKGNEMTIINDNMLSLFEV